MLVSESSTANAQTLPEIGPGLPLPTSASWALYMFLQHTKRSVNPRTAGGRLSAPPPLRFFGDNEKTAERSAAKFCIAIHTTL